MLLRRFTQHVKDQNWFAVALDFLIVVIGILIAFQITEWSGARKERAREGYVLEQIALDLGVIENQARLRVDMYTSKVEAVDRITAFVSSGATQPADEAALLADLNEVLFRWGPVQRSPTYVELLSSGDLGIISDPALRAEIMGFDRRMQDMLRADEVIVDFWVLYNEGLRTKLVLADSFTGDNTINWGVGSYDLAAMREDREFLSTLSWIKRMHFISADANASVETYASALRIKLEESTS